MGDLIELLVVVNATQIIGSLCSSPDSYSNKPMSETARTSGEVDLFRHMITNVKSVLGLGLAMRMRNMRNLRNLRNMRNMQIMRIHMRNMRIENLIHIFHIQRGKTSLFKKQ